MLSRKGQLFGTRNTLIVVLALLSLIALGSLIFIFFSEDEVLDDIGCKTSVYLMDQFAGVTSKGLVPSLCYTQDKVSVATERDAVMAELAESMRSCWNLWGEGDLDPAGENIFKEEFKCFKCERLKFTDFNGRITKTEMEDYLKENGGKGFNGKFWNYFNRAVFFEVEDSNDLIKKDVGYAITYVEDVDTGVIGFITWPITAIQNFFDDAPNSDAIMVTEYGKAGFCGGFFWMKKGEFALSRVAGLILILIAAFVLILFIYFLRDRIAGLLDILKNILKL